MVGRVRSESVRHAFPVHHGHGRGGKLRRESRVGGIQRNGEMRIVGNFKAGKGFRLPVRHILRADNLQRNIGVLVVHLQQPLKGVLHVGSRQRISVGKHDALPQGEIVGQPVLAHMILRAEAGNHLGRSVRRAGLKQPVEHVHRNHVVVCRLRHVHRGDVAQHRHAQQAFLHARFLLCRRFRRGRFRRLFFGRDFRGFVRIVASAPCQRTKHRREQQRREQCPQNPFFHFRFLLCLVCKSAAIISHSLFPVYKGRCVPLPRAVCISEVFFCSFAALCAILLHSTFRRK